MAIATSRRSAVLHVQGGLSMTDDEIGWVFSSYIAAGAIVMPMTHWLAARFGRKRVFLLSIAIFTLALVLDALATTPLAFVGARILQGAGSGTLAPLSMAILLDELPPLRHGHIGPTWSVTAMLGVVSGPAARAASNVKGSKQSERAMRLAMGPVGAARLSPVV